MHFTHPHLHVSHPNLSWLFASCPMVTLAELQPAQGVQSPVKPVVTPKTNLDPIDIYYQKNPETKPMVEA